MKVSPSGHLEGVASSSSYDGKGDNNGKLKKKRMIDSIGVNLRTAGDC